MFKMLQWIFGGKVDVDAGGVPLPTTSTSNTDGLRSPPSVEMVETTSKAGSVSDVLPVSPVQFTSFDKVLRTAQMLVKQWEGKTKYVMGGDSFTTGMDCTSFVARACGTRKYDKDNGVWYNSDAIYEDATNLKKGRRYKQIDKPVAGCIGCYPGKVVDGKRKAGHGFIVEDVRNCTVLESSGSKGGIKRSSRSNWFAKGATGNGRPIIWCEYVGK